MFPAPLSSDCFFASGSPLRREVAATARLAGPLVGAQLAYVGMSFVDTVMAGTLGARSLAAVAVGGSVWASILLFSQGVLMAVPPSVAELDGAGRRKEVGPLAMQGFWISQLLAAAAILLAWNARPLFEMVRVEPDLVPLIVDYLRALSWGMPALFSYLLLRFVCEGLGITRPALYTGLLGLGVNVAANYVLMFGHLGFPPLGAEGCGFATALVWSAQGLAMALYVARSPRLRIPPVEWRVGSPKREPIVELLRIGLPIGVAIFMEISLFTVAALLIGSMGVEVVAGHQVALNFAALTFMVPLGISMAITVRVGNAVGRGDVPGVRRAAVAGIGLALAAAMLSAAVMLVFPEAIAAIFTRDAAVAAIAVELLFLAAIFQLSDGLQVSASGGLRGLKDTRILVIMTLLAYWGIGMPLGAILGFRFGLGARGIWMGLIAGLTAAAVLLAGRLWKRLQEKRGQAPFF